MLTGSLYQDYKTLVNMYNRQNPILTGNIDVDYKILENLEIKDLIKICQSNKYSLNLCNNNTFWFEKFHLNNLPIYAHGTDFTTWAQMYYVTEKSYEKATNTLIVHEINAIDESIDITKSKPSITFLVSKKSFNSGFSQKSNRCPFCKLTNL